MVNVTPKQLGKNVRMSFGKIPNPLESLILSRCRKIRISGSEKKVSVKCSVI